MGFATGLHTGLISPHDRRIRMKIANLRSSKNGFCCFRQIEFRAIAQPLGLSSHLSSRAEVLAVMSQDGHGTETSNSENKATVIEDASKSHNERPAKAFPSIEEHVNENGKSEPVPHVVTEQKRASKIHDFCFGIPFGGLVLSGGVLGFIFSRNSTTLVTGMLFGGALLGLSTFSLKIWRQEKSSLPFILGQAVLSAALLWKNFQAYSLTKKLFPTGFYAFISGAMLCFYTYVVMSGGNPPPKKLKSSAAVPS